eukprot:CAMPEP_0180462652 /NCGR_PEP_ID=MMETSP1036_2-20121128/24519_1 /TAXON_ID=632150 /ORGANISM="Azadinium spinosum, Strain 3D9" /LENGTH=184 /DNA_ID=CAMNT_0022469439 /DNA_START=1 /DNA_END=554 /DNA_ORIENTATION=-
MAEEVLPAERELVEQVRTWFMESQFEALTQEAYRFADLHCHLFEPELGEHKLVYTDLHRQFRQLFEDTLNAFLASLGSTPEAFEVAFEKCVKREVGGADIMAELMYCVMEYEFFCQVMAERKRDKQREEQAAQALAPALAEEAATVPEGVSPGQAVEVMTPEGMAVQVVVPEGVAPGEAFLVTY